MLGTTEKDENLSVSKFYIYHLITYMIKLSLPFINIYKLNTKNNNMNLQSSFRILFIYNQR